jgi:8-amino-3,8-dideoxy-alpha-D-manno-octulosonate transaminase
MVVTDDPEVDKLAREYHDHGHENNPNFPRGRDTHRIYGFNYRMGELQGAIGMVQLQKLETIVAQNRKHYAGLKKGLEQIEGLQFRRVPEQCKSLCDALIFQVPSRELAGKFAQRMAAEGIGTKNLPDAVEWHFAGYWDHIFPHFGVSKEDLWKSLLPTYEKLSRSIAVPVMVKYTPERVSQIVGSLTRIAGELL